MNKTTLIFLAFLAGAAILYYIIPKKIRWIVVLLASIAFYALCDKYLIAFVCFTTVSVYFGARGMQKNNERLKKNMPHTIDEHTIGVVEEKDETTSTQVVAAIETTVLSSSVSDEIAADSVSVGQDSTAIITPSGAQRILQSTDDIPNKKLYKKGKTPLEGKALKEHVKKQNKAIIASIIVLNLAIIGVLKYFNFFGNTINSILVLCGANGIIPTLDLFLPMGISFYTLQAIGYLIDVYRKKYLAERNFAKVALFLLFFPQILEGPIGRFDKLADQLYKGNSANYENIVFGLERIAWGLFKKMVVADRLYMLVYKISEAPNEYSGVASLMFILCYTIQLYADFSGFIDIALGGAQLFGVKMDENFRQPFFAKSAQEFWQRWHITLGTWLKDYVFYSVALSPKLNKGCNALKKKHKNHFTKMLPTAVALLAVWLCNGLWHGPEWKYIVYGMYYFVIIVSGMMLEPVFKKVASKIKINLDSKGWCIVKRIRTLLIIFVGETIFGAKTLKDAFHILGSVFTPYQGDFFSLGLDYKEFIIAVLGIIVIFIVGLIKERGVDVRQGLYEKAVPIRWVVLLALSFSIMVFGAYGGMYSVTPFIYGNF